VVVHPDTDVGVLYFRGRPWVLHNKGGIGCGTLAIFGPLYGRLYSLAGQSLLSVNWEVASVQASSLFV